MKFLLFLAMLFITQSSLLFAEQIPIWAASSESMPCNCIYYQDDYTSYDFSNINNPFHIQNSLSLLWYCRNGLERETIIKLQKLGVIIFANGHDYADNYYTSLFQGAYKILIPKESSFKSKDLYLLLGLRNIIYMSIKGKHIDKKDYKILSKLALRIVELDLIGSDIEQSWVDQIFSKLTKKQFVYSDYSIKMYYSPDSSFKWINKKLRYISYIDDVIKKKHLDSISCCTDLQYLVIKGSKYDSPNLISGKFIDQFKQLKMLQISHFGKYNPPNNKLLESIAKLPKLEILSIELGTDLTPLSKCKHLRWANIMGNNDTDFISNTKSLQTLLGVSIYKTELKKIKMLKNLQSLTVYEPDDSSIQYISQLKGLKKLEIYYGKITTKGVPLLLKYLPSLEDLNLYNPQIGDMAFCNIQKNQKLRKINLSKTQCTEKCLEYLKTLENLEILFLPRKNIDMKKGVLSLLEFKKLKAISFRQDYQERLKNGLELEVLKQNLANPSVITDLWRDK